MKFRPEVCTLEGRLALSTSPSPVLSPPEVDSPPISLGEQTTINLQFANNSIIIALPSEIPTLPVTMVAVVTFTEPPNYGVVLSPLQISFYPAPSFS